MKIKRVILNIFEKCLAGKRSNMEALDDNL
jgi:hypothetical protein